VHDRRLAKRERLTRERHPHIGGLMLALGEQPTHERVWARGADGEERVGDRLVRLCPPPAVLILHDRRIPKSRANIDHIAVTPNGVWVIDSKRYKGKVAISKPLFGQARLTIAGRDQTKLVDGLARQVDLVNNQMLALEPRIPVQGALCFVDADLPLLGKLNFNGYLLLYPKQLAKRLNAPGPVSPERVQELALALAARFPKA
jgi:hypothetical protein